MSIKTRQFLVVFPLFLSLVAHSISFPAKFPHHDAEIPDTCIPLISKHDFPASTHSFLVPSKSKSQTLLWHARLCLHFLHQTHRFETYFCSAEIVLPSAISLMASSTVMRCWSSAENTTQSIVKVSLRFLGAANFGDVNYRLALGKTGLTP